MGCGHSSSQVSAEKEKPEEIKSDHMRVLILVAHVDPTHKATAFRFSESAKQALLDAGHEVRYVNLVEDGFDHGITEKEFKKVEKDPFNFFANTKSENLSDDTQKQQENLKWCTHVIIFAPMWFGRLPAAVYAYTERVITVPFAWDFDHPMEKGFLAGRKVTCILSLGSPPTSFDGSKGNGLDAYAWSALYAFNYCGFTILRSFGIYGANSPNRIEEQPELMRQLNEKIVKLDSWPVIENKKVQPLASLDQLTVDNIIQ